ncbi:MAG: glycosyltransferase family 2 protein [Deltaproteobacteria bacterium]|nr:glycosyltransferase family 2 protein [Deltaproteobacteria bacterium]
MLAFLFFLSLGMIFYVYAGYPVFVHVLGLFVNRTLQKQSAEPFVTILIAAFNEERHIAATIDNKLSLEYPADRLEVIVISDGSTDRTDEIVKNFPDGNLRLLRQEHRSGKTAALNQAVPLAKGEILAFSDANSIWAADALCRLTANFADPGVGYVTGKMVYTNPGGSPVGEGCSTYMKYENFLRAAETRIGSIVGVDGGIDAVRKELYRPMNPDQLPDFVLPLQVVAQGRRVVYEPAALLREPALKEAGDEYRMRVRVSLRAFWALFDMRHLLNPRTDPLFAWQLWSHKVLRYLCFFFLVCAWFCNALLWNSGSFYRVFFVLQNMAYICAGAAPLLSSEGFVGRQLNFFRYFFLINLAAAHALVKFIMGRKQVMWAPRKG